MFVCIGSAWSLYIHIGVGSDVVCSTIIGNARASVRGIDNRTIPRFFLSQFNGFLSRKKLAPI